MTHILLQPMVEAVPHALLPANWVDFELEAFSTPKRLWDYQQKAFQKARHRGKLVIWW